MFSACVNKCYVLHVIYQLSSLDCILKTGESRRNHCAYAVTRAGGGGGCGGVSDPACPGTTMVSRRWVTSTIAQPRICRPRSNTGELQLLWPPAAPQLPTVNTPHPNWGAAHLLNGHYFSFLVSFLAERSCLGVSGPFYILQAEGSEFALYLQVMCLALLYILFQCHGHSIKNIFVFANFILESTTYCISWMCYE